jgi:signal peptidase II
MVRTRGWRWTLIFATTLLVGCDHATKVVAKDALGLGRVVTLVTGWLDLRYAENFDTAFSLTRGWSGSEKGAILSFLAVSTIGVLLLVAWQRRHQSSAQEHAGFALVLAGAIGNAVDRARRGYVIDFIHVHHWPVFNLADVLVVVGGAMLAIAWLPGRSRA